MIRKCIKPLLNNTFLSDGQEQSAGIFDCLLNFAQKGNRFPSID